MKEHEFENILVKYPELIEGGLLLSGRQVNLKGKYVDVLFEDRHKNKLIVELKLGIIKRDHIGQILDYEGLLLTADDPTIRVMLVNNKVPFNLRRALDHHGIEWKELTISNLINFLKDKNDEELLKCFTPEDIEPFTAHQIKRMDAPMVVGSNKTNTLTVQPMKKNKSYNVLPKSNGFERSEYNHSFEKQGGMIDRLLEKGASIRKMASILIEKGFSTRDLITTARRIETHIHHLQREHRVNISKSGGIYKIIK